MTTYSLLMEWGSNDEGTYGAVVKADNLDEAIRLARQEMHDVDLGNSILDEPAEYECVDSVEGANIWAAPQMLAAMKKALPYIKGLGDPAANGIQQALEEAIAEGNGDNQ